MSRSVGSLLTLSLVALGVIWLFEHFPGVAPGGTIPSAAGDPDYWTTPFYLRSNVPVEDTSGYVMPQQPYESWSIALANPSGGPPL